MVVIKDNHNIDTTQFEYKSSQKYQNEISSVFVSYLNQKLIVKTPEIDLLPKIYKHHIKGSQKKFYLFIPLIDRKHSLFQLLTKIDNQFIQDGLYHHMEWFRKKITLGQLEKIYAPIIQIPNQNFPFPELFQLSNFNQTTFRYVKIRIPIDGNMIDCPLFDLSNNRIRLSIQDFENHVLTKNFQKIQMTIQCDGLWFAGEKYGASWRLVNLKWNTIIDTPPQINFKEYCFLDSDEEL